MERGVPLIVLADGEKEDFAGWIEDMYNVLEPYGLTMDTDFMRTVDFLRSNGEGKSEEEEETDERKPAAIDDEKPAAVAAAAAPSAMPAKTAEDVANNNNHLVKENVVNARIEL